ncbi:MAG TPA: hypothetical protein PLY72_17455 [Candidatus Obscuribacter sp.]|nr:hypothetical protein [Candidatus Obscuribacter sp.]
MLLLALLGLASVTAASGYLEVKDDITVNEAKVITPNLIFLNAGDHQYHGGRIFGEPAAIEWKPSEIATVSELFNYITDTHPDINTMVSSVGPIRLIKVENTDDAHTNPIYGLSLPGYIAISERSLTTSKGNQLRTLMHELMHQLDLNCQVADSHFWTRCIGRRLQAMNLAKAHLTAENFEKLIAATESKGLWTSAYACTNRTECLAEVLTWAYLLNSITLSEKLTTTDLIQKLAATTLAQKDQRRQLIEAVSLMHKGDYTEGTSQLNELDKALKQSIRIPVRKAIAQTKQSKWEPAIQSLDQALERASQNGLSIQDWEVTSLLAEKSALLYRLKNLQYAKRLARLVLLLNEGNTTVQPILQMNEEEEVSAAPDNLTDAERKLIEAFTENSAYEAFVRQALSIPVNTIQKRLTLKLSECRFLELLGDISTTAAAREKHYRDSLSVCRLEGADAKFKTLFQIQRAKLLCKLGDWKGAFKSIAKVKAAAPYRSALESLAKESSACDPASGLQTAFELNHIFEEIEICAVGYIDKKVSLSDKELESIISVIGRFSR